MDEADRKILYFLDLNSRASVSKLAAQTGLKQDKVEERLKGLFERKIVRRCYPEIDRAKLGYYPFKIYLQFQNAAPEKIDEIYDYLSSFPNAGWVVTCSGRWDMIMAVWAKDVGEFSKAYECLLSRYHRYILAKVMSITVEFFLLNKKWLWEDGQESAVVRVGGVPNRTADDTDFSILKYLGWNGRATVPEIARDLKMEPAAVEQKIKDMQKKGVILSFRADLDLEALGRTFCKSFVYLAKCSREDEEKLLEYCFRHPAVTCVIRCVGPWDLEIEAHSVSFQEFTETMNDMRNRYPDIVRNFEAVVINRETGVMFAPRGTIPHSAGNGTRKEAAQNAAGKEKEERPSRQVKPQGAPAAPPKAPQAPPAESP